MADAPAELVNHSSLYEGTKDSLEDLRDEFEDKLEDLQRTSKHSTFYNARFSNYVDDFIDITFSGFDKAFDLITDTTFTPIATRDLTPDFAELEKTPVFIGPEYVVLQNKLAEYLLSAGTTELKNVNACGISDALLNSIKSEMLFINSQILNDVISVVNKYDTDDISGNLSWIADRSDMYKTDIDKIIYKTLFYLAQQYSKWAQSTALSLEEAHADFTSKYNKLVTDVVDANIAAYRAETFANIAKFENEIKKIEANIEIIGIETDLSAEEYDLKVKQETNRLASYVSKYSTDVGSNIEMINARMSGLRSVSDGYKSIFSSTAGMFTGISAGRQ